MKKLIDEQTKKRWNKLAALNENLNDKIISKFNKLYSKFEKYFKKNKYKKIYDGIRSAIYDFGYENNIDFDRHVDELDYLTDDIYEKWTN